MANNSFVKGTITLNGEWSKETIDLLILVLNSWRFHGAYGLHKFEKPSLKKKTIQFTALGRWAFNPGSI